jgi:hypothetical protein
VIGMFGHSLDGATAANVMPTDPRVLAAISRNTRVGE